MNTAAEDLIVSVRARPNWGKVLSLEVQVAALRIELRDVRDRAWKWSLFVGGVAFLIGGVLGRAI